MNQTETFAWLEATVGKALAAKDAGDLTMLNRLGQNAALAHYISHVATRQVMTKEQWGQNYYPYMQEADRLREEYDALQEAVAVSPRIQSLETKFDALQQQIAAFMESQQKPAPAKAKSKAGAAEATPAEDAQHEPVESGASEEA